MKTPNEVKSWVDMLLSRRPNVEDRNYLEAIKYYMDKVDKPTGHWCKTGQSFVNSSKFRNYCCSNCLCELDEHIRTEPNFCQNCGADMRGGISNEVVNDA